MPVGRWNTSLHPIWKSCSSTYCRSCSTSFSQCCISQHLLDYYLSRSINHQAFTSHHQILIILSLKHPNQTKPHYLPNIILLPHSDNLIIMNIHSHSRRTIPPLFLMTMYYFFFALSFHLLSFMNDCILFQLDSIKKWF
jgi:hypothetical protein